MLMLFSFLKTNSVKAQTIADSALTVTDTSITTPNNIVVTDSSGNTTLFAGGQQSNFEGKVGVGTDVPKEKLTVYDDVNAALLIRQKTLIPAITTTAQRTMHGAATAGASSLGLGITNERLDNFEINFTDGTIPGDFRNQGTVELGTYWGPEPPNTVIHLSQFITEHTINSANWNPCGQANTSAVMYPDMSYKAGSYTWLTSRTDDCNSQSTLLPAMYLSNSGDLTVEGSVNVGKDLTIVGTINMLGSMNNLSVNKCDNTQYAATITNCGGEEKDYW